ncbi:MAG: ABC transporter substrate-binding protein [Bryobacteraceae bacterium]
MTVWLTAVLFFFIAACSMAQESVSPGIPGGTLRVAQKAEPKTLNPLLAIDAPSREVIRLLHSDLITINRGTHRAEAELAAACLFDGIPILPKHLLEADYRAGRITKLWTLASKPDPISGPGPFRLRAHKPGESTSLVRNPHDWESALNGDRLRYFDAVELRPMGSEENQIVRFFGGVEQKQFPGTRLVGAGSSLEYNAAFFNLDATAPAAVRARQRWFRDRRIRYGGRTFARWSHVPPDNRQLVDDEIAKPPRSIPGARTLLQQACYRWNGARLLDAAGTPAQFSILVSSSNAERMRMAAILASDWRELRADVQVAGLDRLADTKDFDVCLIGLGGGDADPNPEMNVWLSSRSMHLGESQSDPLRRHLGRRGWSTS